MLILKSSKTLSSDFVSFQVLNDTGCIEFKRSVEALKRFGGNLSLVESGVKERYENNNCETYSTSERVCNCTYWNHYKCPCRHILFYRQNKDLSLFDKLTFPEYYWLERLDDLVDCPRSDKENIDDHHEIVEQAEETVALSQQEKYR